MNALRRLANRLKPLRQEPLDPTLAELERIWRHPAATRRNTPRRGNR